MRSRAFGVWDPTNCIQFGHTRVMSMSSVSRRPSAKEPIKNDYTRTRTHARTRTDTGNFGYKTHARVLDMQRIAHTTIPTPFLMAARVSRAAGGAGAEARACAGNRQVIAVATCLHARAPLAQGGKTSER